MPVESYPLTPTQQGMLFNSLRAGGGRVEIEQVVCHLHGPVDAPRLRAAWELASERHAVLRTRFVWHDGGEPRQVVVPHAPIPFEVHERDAAVPQSERDAALAQFLEDDRERGFDLSRAPLARLTLFVHAPDLHVLVWTFHHALLDGRSFTRVLREVFEGYDGRSEPSEPPTPFRAHCEHLARRDTQAEQAFWTAQLRGFPGTTPLPAARPTRRAMERPPHAELEIAVGAGVIESLSALGALHGFSLANAVQGAWAITLARHARTDDVCFGSTRAARHTSVPGALDMIGCLINTVPLRIAVPPEAELLPWLGGLRELGVQIRPHEQASLVSMRGWAGLPQEAPVFETLVVFERYLVDTELRALGGAWASRRFSVREQSDFPLVLAAYQDRGDLIVKLEHDPRRCDPAAVARLLGHVVTLLRAMASSPGVTLRELPMLTAEERNALLDACGGEGAMSDVPALTWPDAFDARVIETPEAIALVHETGSLSFRELDRGAAAVAARVSERGVSAGDVVAVCLPRSPLLATALLAILRSGAVYLPIDPSWPRDRIAMLLEDSRAKLVLAQRSTRSSVGLADVLVLDEPTAIDRATTPRDAIDPASPAYLLYTSGSTGRPKGVLVTHRALMAHARAIVPAFQLSPADRCLQFTSPSFDVSLEEMLPSWMAGAAVVLRSDAASTSIETFLSEIDRHRVTVINVPSAFFGEVAHHVREQRVSMPQRVRLVVVGGERTSPIGYASWRRHHPSVRFINAYGPTEATITSTLCDPTEAGVPADGLSELPIGRPLGATRAYVLDDRGELAPLDVPGELCLAGPQVALGYLRQPELTAEKFVADPFRDGPMYRTGDLVRRRSDGNLEFLGRIDAQIKIRGFRIEPGEIETLLLGDARVRAAFVGARPDRNGSLRLIAWVVPTDDARGSLTGEALLAICADRLPSYMLPSAIAVLDTLPLTPGGKVDQRALPEPEASAPVATSFVPPDGDVETWLASLFGELLAQDRISATDSFFELGGHSLLALRLLSAINARAKQQPVELGTIFSHPTVRGLASALATGGRTMVPTIVALNRADPSAVPLFCVCGVQLYQQLARAMEPDRAVLGVYLPIEATALASDGAVELDVPEMAAGYVELLREHRPHGPYLLGGVSFGGILAFEMAQQLRARGETVELLVLFDAILPRALHRLGTIDRARAHLRKLVEDPRALAEHFAERLRLRRMGRTAARAARDQVALAHLRDQLFRRASEEYDRVVRPYTGRVVSFSASEGTGSDTERVDRDRGWSGLVPDDSPAHVIEGSHTSIIQEHAVEIARALRAHLRDLDEPGRLRRAPSRAVGASGARER